MEINIKLTEDKKEYAENITDIIQTTIENSILEQLKENGFNEISIGKLKLQTIQKLAENNTIDLSLLETICAYVDSFVEYLNNKDKQ